MSSQVLLWISIGLIVVFAYLFWRSRRAALSPSRLKLKKTKYDVQQNSSPTYDEARTEVKNLNVIFMFNGHSFDAYEVFGLPAGSGLPAIEEAYIKALTSNASDSREFIEAAYQALIKAKK